MSMIIRRIILILIIIQWAVNARGQLSEAIVSGYYLWQLRSAYLSIKDKDIDLTSNTRLHLSLIDDNVLKFHPQLGCNIGTNVELRINGYKSAYKTIGINPEYSFIRRAFLPKIWYKMSGDAWIFGASAGRKFEDYNRLNAVRWWGNTKSCLYTHRNHKSLYERRFANVNLSYLTDNHSSFTLDLEHYEAKSARQVSDFSFFRRHKDYKLLVPDCERFLPIDTTHSFRNQDNITVKIFKTFPAENQLKGEFSFTQGVGNLDNSVAFSRVEARLQQTISLPFANFVDAIFFDAPNTIYWSIGAGYMTNNDAHDVKFSDWMHFASAERVFASSTKDGFSSFVTFSPYEMSTRKWYVSLNAHVSLNEFIFSQIRSLQKARVTEELYLNHACVEGEKNYTEVGYALVILKQVRYAAFVSLKDFEYKGVNFRLGVNLWN